MLRFILIVLFATLVVSGAESDIARFMKHLEVIPDVINEGPDEYLTVRYGNNIQADKGVELTPTQVKDQPSVKWKAEQGSYYTLAMVDPDAPSRKEPKMREWQHWLVGNIPGKELQKGDVLSEYVGAGPPKGTGQHRYVFLVYKQPSGKISFSEPKLTNKSAKNRGKFSVRKFASKYDLGRPIAGNFFQAQWDEYVPKLYAQLGAN